MKAFLDIIKNDDASIGVPREHFIDCINETYLENIKPKTLNALKAYKAELMLTDLSKPVIIVGMGTCGLANGAQKVFDRFKDELNTRKIDAQIISTGCVGYCAEEVIVDIKLPGRPRISYARVKPKDVPNIIETTLINKEPVRDKVLGVYDEINSQVWDNLPIIDNIPFFKIQQKIVLENCGVIDPENIDQYIVKGGYKGLSRILKSLKAEDVIDEVLKAGLRGRGGGGFPTGQKWKFARQSQGEKKYLICNADEGDPGAFMDRAILEGDPHRVVEGMVIAAYAIGANEGYIYCRAEYPLAIKRLKKTLADAELYGLLGENILNSGFSFKLKIKEGAGAFVCGEETALINSIEGNRGTPRPRPPYPTTEGLWGMPTVINNVETFANVPVIIRKGADWYSSVGTQSSKGTKIFALSGKVNNVGLVEVPMGTTLRQIVYDVGGGIPDGRKFKAVQIGGPSGGALPESVIDTPVDYENLKGIGAMMGSGGLVVMDETTCMVDLAKYFMTFIMSESCGKCIPCREGTKRLYETLDRLTRSYKNENDPEEALLRFQGMVYLERLAKVITTTSLCGLGQTAANPVMSTLRYFRDEYEAHLYERRCPSGVCKELLTYKIDTDKCTGCTICALKCPVDAILGERKKAHYIITDKCTRCGQCMMNCNFNAIYVE